MTENHEILYVDALKPYQAPQTTRPLVEIYCELGHALLQLGNDLNAAKQIEKSEKRYAEAAQAFKDAIHEKPDSAELQLLLAEARKAQGRFSEALKCYLEAILLNPDCAVDILPEAHQLLTREQSRSLSNWINNEWRNAIETSIPSHEAIAAIFQFLGRVDLYREDFPQALQDFHHALSEQPEDSFILEGLGETLEKSNQLEQAAEILQQAVSQTDNQPDVNHRVSVYLKLAKVLRDLKRYEQAINVANQGVHLTHGKDTDFYIVLSQCFWHLNQPILALEKADEALKLDADHAKAYAIRAAALYDLKRYTESASTAEEALKRNPNDSLAIRIKAQALIESNSDLEQAIRLLQVYIRQKPTDWERQLLLVQALRQLEKPINEVKNALQKLISIAPSDQQPVLMMDLAELYIQENQSSTVDITEDKDLPAETLKILEDVVSQNPNLRSTRWWQLHGDANRQANNIIAAIQDYQQRLNLEPGDLSLLRQIAELYEKQNDLAAASQAWQTLVEVFPDDSNAHLRLAQVLCSLEQWPESLEAVNQALELGLEDKPEIEAYKLKGEVLNDLKRSPDEIALAYYEAGQRSSWINDYSSAVELLKQSLKLNSEYVPTYWHLSESLRMMSYQLSDNSLLNYNQNLLIESLQTWDEGAAIKLPDIDYSWSYLTRAFLSEMLAKMPDEDRLQLYKLNEDRLQLYWRAITYLERALLLNNQDSYRWAYLGRFHRALNNEFTSFYAAIKATELDSENLTALEEKAAILSNFGYFKDALDTIDQRLAKEADPWSEAVKAYILMHSDKVQDSLPLLDKSVEALPNDLWRQNLRADCYKMLGKPDFAKRDYTRIWEKYDSKDIENQEYFGWAAYNLGEINTAIEIFGNLRNDPIISPGSVLQNLGLCYLAKGDLDEGKNYLEQGIKLGTNIQNLDDLLNINIGELEISSAQWSYGAELHLVLGQLKDQIKDRKNYLYQQYSNKIELQQTLEELQHLIIKLEENHERDWNWIGIQSGLARLYVEKQQWHDAETIYQFLNQQLERFPEAYLGLEQVCNGRIAQAREQLQAGQFLSVSEELSQALCEGALPCNSIKLAEIHTLIGSAYVGLNSIDQAREYFCLAVQTYAQSDVHNPGKAAGQVCYETVSDINHYWALNSFFDNSNQEYIANGDQFLSHSFAIAREILSNYINDLFKLRMTDSSDQIPVVTPIVVEVGDAIIPIVDNKQDNGHFISELIPQMRDRVKANFGINIPGIRLRANPALAAEAYLFMIDEVPIARGNVHVGMYFFEGAIDVLNELGLADQSISDIQPLTHKTGHWVPDSAQTAIQAAEHELIPAPTHLLDQFEALIRRNLVRFFGIQDAETLLQSWESSETSKSLVVALHLTSRDRLRLIQVLRELIRDRVPLTQGETILNALQGTNLASDDIHHLTRLVRLQIRHQLPSNTPGTIRVPIPLVEEQKLFTITDGRALFIASPQQKHEFLVWLRDQLQELQTDPFNIVLVTPNPEPRPLLRRLIEPEFPDLMVLSQEEILEFSETLSSSSSDESPTTKPSESPPLTTTPTPNDESEEVTE